MDYNTKVINAKTTYITSAYPEGSFYFSEGILAGIVSNKCDLNAYKTLLKFNFANVPKCNLKSAFLYLYVKDRSCIESIYNSNLIIAKNIERFDIKCVNWYNQPKSNLDEIIKLIVREEDEECYIKIDIRSFIEAGIIDDCEFGLTIQGIGQCKTSLVKFASCNTNNGPYIEIKYNSPCDDYGTYPDYNCHCGHRPNPCGHKPTYCESHGFDKIKNCCCKNDAEVEGQGVQNSITFNTDNSHFYSKHQVVTYNGDEYIANIDNPQGYPGESEDYVLIDQSKQLEE